MISRRAFIQTLAGVAALGAIPARASAALNFLVFGDWGMADSKILPRIAEQMSMVAEQTDSQFAITTGDNFYPNGVASLNDPLWQLLQTNFTTDELKRPWYPVLGNHDWRGNVEAQIAYTEVDPRWRMPGRVFSHIEPVSDSDKAEFFHIDTTALAEPELLRGARDDQLDWLDRALTASTEKWKNRRRASPRLFGRKTRRYARVDRAAGADSEIARGAYLSERPRSRSSTYRT